MLNLSKKALFSSVLVTLIIAGCSSNTSNPMQEAILTPKAEQTDLNANNYRYKVEEIRGIAEVYGKKLNDHGIKYTDQLLKATAKRKDRETFSAKTGISHKLLLTWANHIDLMRISGIGPKQSNWLEAVGVDSIPELAQRSPVNLHERLEIANNIDPKRKFVLRMPSLKEIQKWVDLAKKTEPLVEVSH